MVDTPPPHPVSQGATRALLEEYERAAGEFCQAVERFPSEGFGEGRASDDPSCTSLREIARHVCHAARHYAADLGRALDPGYAMPDWPHIDALSEPLDTRLHLDAALRHTTEVASRLETMSPEEVTATRFEMSWGQVYDPEILLEHAIVHLLRHRRQVERW
jgi:uncharacterized damage-inducible protein DinB